MLKPVLGQLWLLETSGYILATTVRVSPSWLDQIFAQRCPFVWDCFSEGSGGATLVQRDQVILTTFGTCLGSAATRRSESLPSRARSPALKKPLSPALPFPSGHPKGTSHLPRNALLAKTLHSNNCMLSVPMPCCQQT